MPLARHLTPDSNKNTQVPRTVNTHTELTGGPAYPDCRPPPGRSVTDSQVPFSDSTVLVTLSASPAESSSESLRGDSGMITRGEYPTLARLSVRECCVPRQREAH